MNSELVSCIIPVILIIIFTLIGFYAYNLYVIPVQEGLAVRTKKLEPRIKRADGKIVKRRKKRPIIEGIDDPFSEAIDAIKESIENTKRAFERAGEILQKTFQIFDEVKKGFSRMVNFFGTIKEIFNYIPRLFSYLGRYMEHVLSNIARSFLYIPSVFKWLGSYVTGGFRFVVNLNKCFGWYSLDAFGKILYLPIRYLVWLFSLEDIEDMLWGYAENIDCMVKKYTGYHLIHFSDSIQDRCYSFCPDEFPRFPQLDWSFNPPTLRLNSNW